MNKLVIIIVVVLVGAGVWWGFGLMESNKALKTPATSNVTQKEVVTAAENMVELKGFAFNPKTLTVAVGTTVTFKNSDVAGHTVTADDKSFESEVMNQGESTTVTFDKAGTFGFHCNPHPNMKFTVTVK